MPLKLRLLTIFARLFGVLILVYATYNPEGWSYYHWAIADLQFSGFSLSELPPFNPPKVFVGVVLVIGWIVLLATTRKSLGIIGVFLASAFFGSLVWVLIYYNILPVGDYRVVHHIILFMISAVLTVGLSWSLISRAVTGQVDMDRIDN